MPMLLNHSRDHTPMALHHSLSTRTCTEDYYCKYHDDDDNYHFYYYFSRDPTF